TRLSDLGLCDADAEAFQPDIVALARGDQVDRGDAEVLQDLGSEPDLAPFVLAIARFLVVLVAAPVAALLLADTDGAFPQIDDDAALLRAHRLHDAIQPAARAEHVGNDIFRMQAHRHFLAIANVSEDDGQM